MSSAATAGTSSFFEAEDKTATVILETLEPVVPTRKFKFPRGGYLMRRGRGRVIVGPAQYE